MNQNPANLPHFPVSQSATEFVPAEILQAEETLRQLARLEPPIGVADRVHYRLQRAQNAPPSKGFWASWMPLRRMQYAGAAILTIAVGVSSWGVYHAHRAVGPHSVNPQLQGTPPSSFGTAGAERHPGTLAPIKVPPVHKKKPSASRVKPAATATQLSNEPGTSRSSSGVSGSASDANVARPKH